MRCCSERSYFRPLEAEQGRRFCETVGIAANRSCDRNHNFRVLALVGSPSMSAANSQFMPLVVHKYFIDDLGDLNGLGVVSFARQTAGLKPGEPRFGHHAALPDDAYTNSSKWGTQSISELISGAVEPSNLWCIVKH
jgi:hypothetical protein